MMVDLHCDTVMAIRRGYDLAAHHDSYHVDIPRLREGNVGVQVFACTANMTELKQSPLDYVMRSIDLLSEAIVKNGDTIEICLNSSDVQHAGANNKIAAIIAIEGGLALENKPKNVEYFRKQGVRLITIAHESPTGWCANWKEHNTSFKGLSELGREFIEEMNHQGIIIDLSHSSDETVEAVLRISKAPVIASHSNARALCNHSRNLTDEQIKAIAKTGGVIGVTFVNNFLSEKYNNAYNQFWNTVPPEMLKALLQLYSSELDDRYYQEALKRDFDFIIKGEQNLQIYHASVSDVIDQIDYIVKLAGIEYVAIGSDFDGMSSTPVGLENCSCMPAITEELLNRSFVKTGIEMIIRDNFLRVFRNICG